MMTKLAHVLFASLLSMDLMGHDVTVTVLLWFQ